MNRDPDSTRRKERRAPRADARTLPAPVFPAVLAVLLALAILSTFVPTREVEGLPPDPSARAARDLLYGHISLAAGDLRFGSVFLGDSAGVTHAGSADPALLARARALLERARKAHPFEPRVVAALGHLELAAREFGRAEALYQTAIDLRAHCTEARLGLGVALALQADATGDLFARRALQLRSLAQFLAIGPRSARAREALYDRALLEERVGRHRDALQSGREFLAAEPDDAWSARLRGALALAGAGGAAPPAGARAGATVTDASGRSSSGNP